MMKRFLFLVVIATAATVPLGAHNADGARAFGVPRSEHARESYQRDRDERTERVSRTLKVGSSGELDLSNIAGDILVTGSGGDDIRIDAVKRASDSGGGDPKRQLSLVTIEFDERPERAEVRTVYARGERNINVTVDYTVSVPAGLRVTAKSVSGDVKVVGVQGELRAESVSGGVTVDSASRVAVVKSVSGDVNVISIGTDGDLSASSVSGSIQARNVKARTIDFGTVSGDVVLNKITCTRANVRSVSGGVEYSGPLAKGGRYEMKSHSGDLRLILVGDTGFEITATSFSGSVRSDLPLTLSAREPGDDDDAHSQHRSNRAVRGQYGDGSAVLDLTTFSGDIVVSRP